MKLGKIIEINNKTNILLINKITVYLLTPCEYTFKDVFNLIGNLLTTFDMNVCENDLNPLKQKKTKQDILDFIPFIVNRDYKDKLIYILKTLITYEYN